MITVTDIRQADGEKCLQCRERESVIQRLEQIMREQEPEAPISLTPVNSRASRDQTRVDFLDLSHWGRAVLKDIGFYEVNGNTVFPIDRLK